MASFADELRAKNVDGALRAFDQVRASGEAIDPRALAALCNLCALNRKNEQAHSAFSLGCSTHGAQALVGAGLNLNALLYACCRDPSKMLTQAMGIWGAMSELGVKLDTEPANKLILANITQGEHEAAFGAFLGAIDSGVQPSESVCAALIRTCGADARHAQSAFAVWMVMQNGGMLLPPELATVLATACLSDGTLDQAIAVYDSIQRGATQPPDVVLTSALAAQCASATPAQPARGAALLRSLRAAGLKPTPAACSVVLEGLCRVASGRPNQPSVNSAFDLLCEMQAPPDPPAVAPAPPDPTLTPHRASLKRAHRAPHRPTERLPPLTSHPSPPPTHRSPLQHALVPLHLARRPSSRWLTLRLESTPRAAEPRALLGHGRMGGYQWPRRCRSHPCG